MSENGHDGSKFAAVDDLSLRFSTPAGDVSSVGRNSLEAAFEHGDEEAAVAALKHELWQAEKNGGISNAALASLDNKKGEAGPAFVPKRFDEKSDDQLELVFADAKHRLGILSRNVQEQRNEYGLRTGRKRDLAPHEREEVFVEANKWIDAATALHNRYSDPDDESPRISESIVVEDIQVQVRSMFPEIDRDLSLKTKGIRADLERIDRFVDRAYNGESFTADEISHLLKLRNSVDETLDELGGATVLINPIFQGRIRGRKADVAAISEHNRREQKALLAADVHNQTVADREFDAEVDATMNPRSRGKIAAKVGVFVLSVAVVVGTFYELRSDDASESQGQLQSTSVVDVGPSDSFELPDLTPEVNPNAAVVNEDVVIERLSENLPTTRVNRVLSILHRIRSQQPVPEDELPEGTSGAEDPGIIAEGLDSVGS